MKNFKLTALAVLLSTGLFAQNFYITANAGYAFGINSQTGMYVNSNQISNNNYLDNVFTKSGSTENVPLSLGKGINLGGSVGYMFNDYIGIDVGLNYLLGGKTEATSYSKSTVIYPNTGEKIVSESNTKNVIYSRMFRVIPAIIITPGFEKFNPYAKIGVVLGFGSFYTEDEISSSSTGVSAPPPYNIINNQTFSGGMAFGFNGTFGASYNLNEKLSLFGEASFIGMSYSPTKSKITKYTNNGVDELPNMITYYTESEYVDNLSLNSEPIYSDEPAKKIKTSYPMSSIGLNLGVKFNF